MTSTRIESEIGAGPGRSLSSVVKQRTAPADSQTETNPSNRSANDALPSEQEIRQALDEVSSRLAASSAELQFQVDYVSKTLNLTLVDRKTGEVLATIPKPLLRLDLPSVARGLGALIDERW